MTELQQKTLYREGKPLINSKIKQTHFILGFTGSAKSTWGESIAKYLHRKGQTVFDGFAGDLFENMFWPVVVNCKEDPDPDNPCTCGGFDNDDARIPITVFCQNNIVFLDEKGNETEQPIKNWNRNGFSHWEFKKFIQQNPDQRFGIFEYDPNHPPQKPQGLPRVDWVKFVKLPSAQKTGSGKGIFDSENNKMISEIFIKEMEIAKNERRMCVFNPGMFPREFQRYQVLNIFARSIRDAKMRVFQSPTEVEIGKPRTEWSDWDRNRDKMVLFMRELGELLNQEMKSDESGQSTLVKKAILNYIRKARQYGTGLIGDFQRNDDVFKGIRVHGDVFWIKYGPEWLYGESWEWLFEKINDERQKILDDTNWNFELANDRWPRIQDLGPNWAYAVRKESNKPTLVETPMPDHHHWRPGDDFSKITGIYWLFKDEPNKQTTISPTGETVEFNDNTVEMVTLIQNPTPELRKKWKKEFNIDVKNKPKNWTVVHEIYQKYLEAKQIQTMNPRNSWQALKVYVNRQKKHK